MGTIMGSGENAISGGLLSQVSNFGFLNWMIYGVPVVLVLIPLSWFALTKVLPIGNVFIDTVPISQELDRLGGIRGPEIEIIGIGLTITSILLVILQLSSFVIVAL